jgi:hypothetical protein
MAVSSADSISSRRFELRAADLAIAASNPSSAPSSKPRRSTLFAGSSSTKDSAEDNAKRDPVGAGVSGVFNFASRDLGGLRRVGASLRRDDYRVALYRAGPIVVPVVLISPLAAVRRMISAGAISSLRDGLA